MKKLNKPNYKGFVLHTEEWDKHGIAYGINDLIDLSHKYNTPIPTLARKEKGLLGISREDK